MLLTHKTKLSRGVGRYIFIDEHPNIPQELIEVLKRPRAEFIVDEFSTFKKASQDSQKSD